MSEGFMKIEPLRTISFSSTYFIANISMVKIDLIRSIKLKNIYAIVLVSMFYISAYADSSSLASNSIGIISQQDFLPPANVIGTSAWLPVQQIRQETNLCVPTSSAMVLSYYGVTSISPREIKVWSTGLEFNPNLPFNDFTATYFDNLLKGLRKHDINWQKYLYLNNDEGFSNGIKSIKDQLDLGHPVIVDTNLYTGHTFVIDGYDNDKNILIIEDPFIQMPGIRIISIDDFKQIWNSTKVNSSIRAAIFTVGSLIN
jgi:uncharacterized protein YvpB